MEEFKVFASKKTRRGVNFDTLVSAFLYDSASSQPKNKGAMFPKGTGGDNKKTTVNDGTISLADGELLRKTNYPKYKEMLLSGKIRNE